MVFQTMSSAVQRQQRTFFPPPKLRAEKSSAGEVYSTLNTPQKYYNFFFFPEKDKVFSIKSVLQLERVYLRQSQILSLESLRRKGK